MYCVRSTLRTASRIHPVVTCLLPTMTTRSASHSAHGLNVRPETDRVIQDISKYVHTPEKTQSPLARETARLCLIDTLGCGLEALRFKECTKLLGPVVEGSFDPTMLSDFQVLRYPMGPKFQERIINWTLFGVRSTLGL